MNQEDFERLKAKLGDEFEIIQDALVSIDGTIAFVRKKDVWDGVEFAEYVHFPMKGLVHFKIEKSDEQYLYMSDGSELFKHNCKPSTEQAYIEQLKKEAHERFGEINIGDKFNRDWDIKNEPKYGIGIVGDNKDTGFEYRKSNDSFMVKGTTIYREGKWATRVKERVKVELIHETLSNNPTYQFKLSNWNETNRAKYSGQFLASQLEAYLNLDGYSVDVSGQTLSIHVKIRNGVDLEDLKEKAESLAKIVKKI